MGDAVLATCIFNTIKQNDPEAETFFVLNERIAPVFEGHPAIDHIITFSDEERHNFRKYIAKVWGIMRKNRFDVVIDLRSTMNTLPFTLFARKAHYRIGIRKWYTPFFNYRFSACTADESMVHHDLSLLNPLGFKSVNPDFSLSVTDAERQRFAAYLKDCGLDLNKPIALLGVTAKLPDKCWSFDGMEYVTQHLVSKYPDLQIIYNFAPGREEKEAKMVYEKTGRDPHIFINVKARSQRELCVMSTFVTLYFGNEGGTRHIVQASGKPSFVVVSPQQHSKVWVVQNDVAAGSIDVDDVLSPESKATLNYQQQYQALTPELVWNSFDSFIEQNHLL